VKPIKTISQLKREYKSIRSGVADDTLFMAKAMMFLIENLKHSLIKPKRKASDWSIFLGNYLRKGKSIKEAAIDWGIRKNQ
jgi:hypothetical protein